MKSDGDIHKKCSLNGVQSAHSIMTTLGAETEIDPRSIWSVVTIDDMYVWIMYGFKLLRESMEHRKKGVTTQLIKRKKSASGKLLFQ